MNKFVITTIVFVLFIVFAVPGLLGLFIKIVPYADQPGYSVDNRKSIYFENFVTQSFAVQEDRFTGIGLTIGNPNLKNKSAVILKVYEGDIEEDEEPLREVAFNGRNIPDGHFVRFLFDPIQDSYGKNYTFTLESPDAREDSVVNLYFSTTAPDWVRDVTYLGEQFDGGKLAFVTYHKPVSKSALVREIYSNWLGRIVGAN